MQLSVIIVNYNVRYFLEQALLSVRSASTQIESEVWVVDNASSDESVSMVKERFPEVKLIANAENVGFSTANNQAIRKASGEYILLLNPDTVVEENTFTECIAFMEGHPKAGALGVRMIDGSGSFLPESKRGFPSPWVAFCKTIGLSRLFPKSRLFNRYHLGYLSDDQTHEVDVLSGAFMFLRKTTLDQIGLLDETFFMYGEDIDLSYRIQLGGWKNYYLSAARIIHYKGESTRRGSLNYVRTFYQAMIIFARKHFDGSKAGLFVGMIRIGIYVRAVLTLFQLWWSKLRISLFDSILIMLGLYVLQQLWGHFRFDDPNYYNWRFKLVSAPMYTLFWLSGIYFSGGYYEPFHIGRLIRGLLVGTMVIAAVYGFLPLEFRSSRALIILGVCWSMIALIASRYVLHYRKYGNGQLFQPKNRNLLIIGGNKESKRVRELLQHAQTQHNIIGTVSPEDDYDNDLFIGRLDQLRELSSIYEAQEFIFCSADVQTQDILHWMTELGAAYEYKILPEESLSIIGSHSKNSSGELYTVEISFQIDKPLHRRNKRIFDFGSSLFILLFFPVLVWKMRQPKQCFKNCLDVFLGRKTWVGYSRTEKKLRLPPLRTHVYTPLDGLQLKSKLDEATKARLNFLYAKEYSINRDVSILWKALF